MQAGLAFQELLVNFPRTCPRRKPKNNNKVRVTDPFHVGRYAMAQSVELVLTSRRPR